MIFSGDESRKLWDKINKIKDLNLNKKDIFWDIWDAMYLLGCRCQELESKLEEIDKKAMNISTKEILKK